MTQVTKVVVQGARGPRGLASGPLGAGSVDSETISNDSGEQSAIVDKLGAISEVNLASTASGKGAAMIGFIQSGTGAVARTAQAKMRDAIDVWDFIPSGTDTTATDCTAYIQAAIDAAKSSSSVSVDSTAIRYASRGVRFKPGLYLCSSSLLADADVALLCETQSGAILKYTGTGNALVVNSTDTGVYGSAAQNTRVFEMNGIAILAESASVGVLIGSATQRHISFKRGQIYGATTGLLCGEAVYFLGLSQMDIRGCGVGVSVGAYCDLFTVNDRCVFTGNSECDIKMECPTFHIENNDFELGIAADCAIKIQHTSASVAELRSGVIFNNRFGPESYDSSAPYTYDIWIYDNGAAGAMDGIRIRDNKHVSYADGRQKTAPIYIDGKLKRIRIEGNFSNGYPSSYVEGDAAKAFASGTVVSENFVDDIMTVDDDIKGLFTRTETKHVRPVVSASTPAKFSSLRFVARSTANGWSAPSVSTLPASGSSTNYTNYAGIALHAGVASRVLWVSEPGLEITSTIDASGAAVLDPVYIDGSAALSLSGTSVNFQVAKVLAATTNAPILTIAP